MGGHTMLKAGAVSKRNRDRRKCPCGKPVVQGCRNKWLRGYCWACGERVLRADTIRRLTKSGKMAAMRRAMEACPDAGRTEAAPIDELGNPCHELAASLLVGVSNAERSAHTDGELLVARPKTGRGTDAIRHPWVPWNVRPTGLRYTGKW